MTRTEEPSHRLRAAIAAGDHAEAAAAIAAGATVSTGACGDELLLWEAIRLDDQAMVALLLDAGVDPNEVDDLGSTALGAAAFYGRPQIARLLLERGADPNHPACATSPLAVAADHGHREVCLLLLERGADPAATDLVRGWDAMLYAVRNNDVELVGALLAHGGRVHGRRFPNGDPLLSHAVALGDLAMTQLLLELGADPRQSDAQGRPPLHYTAAFHRDPLVAERLLAAGAALTDLDSTGRTPLDVARARNNHRMEAWIRKAQQ